MTVSRWTDATLAEVLGTGTFRVPDLDSTMQGPPLLVRLWDGQREGSCVDGTHFVCQHDYLLSVVTGDLGETPGLFSLGRVGEITALRWVGDSVPWTIELTVSNYPPRSKVAATDWTLTSRKVSLRLSYDSVWIAR